MTTAVETPTLTPADIIAAVRTTPMTLDDYAEIIRAITGAIPDLLPPDPSQTNKLRTAARISPKFIEAAATGLKSSTLWQQSSVTNPDELLGQLNRSRGWLELFRESSALAEVSKFNHLYHHSVAATKARKAYHNGRTIGGDDGLILKPHLDVLQDLFPKSGRSGPKPPEPPTTPPQPPAPPQPTQTH